MGDSDANDGTGQEETKYGPIPTRSSQGKMEESHYIDISKLDEVARDKLAKEEILDKVLLLKKIISNRISEPKLEPIRGYIYYNITRGDDGKFRWVSEITDEQEIQKYVNNILRKLIEEELPALQPEEILFVETSLTVVERIEYRRGLQPATAMPYEHMPANLSEEASRTRTDEDENNSQGLRVTSSNYTEIPVQGGQAAGKTHYSPIGGMPNGPSQPSLQPTKKQSTYTSISSLDAKVSNNPIRRIVDKLIAYFKKLLGIDAHSKIDDKDVTTRNKNGSCREFQEEDEETGAIQYAPISDSESIYVPLSELRRQLQQEQQLKNGTEGQYGKIFSPNIQTQQPLQPQIISIQPKNDPIKSLFNAQRWQKFAKENAGDIQGDQIYFCGKQITAKQNAKAGITFTALPNNNEAKNKEEIINKTIALTKQTIEQANSTMLVEIKGTVNDVSKTFAGLKAIANAQIKIDESTLVKFNSLAAGDANDVNQAEQECAKKFLKEYEDYQAKLQHEPKKSRP